MSSRLFLRLWVGLFVLAFFAYLFGPLVLMSLTAFNSASFPRVSPWDCFTLEWFQVLVDDRELMEGLRNSLFIGFGVVLVAVPLGLAGALLLTQIGRRVRSIYYTVVISPILIPGVVLGISTLIFWDRLGVMVDASYDSVFYDGIFLTVLGQATFISAYAMLVFIARLQRFDPALEEAALDLGATHVQAFRKILLPFLKPAIFSAAVLAFLASFENYNTTVFTILSERTLTTVLASKVRYGINPSISALAVIIVGLTLVGAIIYEVLRRREEAREAGLPIPVQRRAMFNPVMLLLTLVFIAGLGMTWLNASGYDARACKVAVEEQRRLEAQRRTEELLRQRQQQQPATPATPAPAPARPAEDYQNIFDPSNLGGQNEESPETGGSSTEDSSAPAGDYQGIFDPNMLRGQSGTDDDSQTEEPTPAESPNPFDPGTLQPGN